MNRTSILISVSAIASLLSMLSVPANAQSADGGIFHIPNFETSWKNIDLYRDLHPPTPPPWDDYRNLVRSFAQQRPVVPPGYGVGLPDPNQPITDLGSPINSPPTAPPFVPQDSESIPVGTTAVPGLVNQGSSGGMNMQSIPIMPVTQTSIMSPSGMSTQTMSSSAMTLSGMNTLGMSTSGMRTAGMNSAGMSTTNMSQGMPMNYAGVPTLNMQTTVPPVMPQMTSGAMTTP